MKVLVDASLLIYLNAPLPESDAQVIEEFWLDLVKNHELYTNGLVLDEVVYVSKKKYGIPPYYTLEFIDRAILTYTQVLPLRIEEYLEAKTFITRYGLKPSDALHAATVQVNKLDAIATEDSVFERTGLKRLWIGT